VRLLKPETIEKARTLRTGAMSPAGDLAKLQLGTPLDYGLGYEFPRGDVLPMLGQGSFGHAGAGGRLGFAHPESGTAVGYVANTMLSVPAGPDPRWIGWTKALQDAVGAG
jgi:CubicO group peptidase (beta-lactamase class C family)